MRKKRSREDDDLVPPRKITGKELSEAVGRMFKRKFLQGVNYFLIMLR